MDWPAPTAIAKSPFAALSLMVSVAVLPSSVWVTVITPVRAVKLGLGSTFHEIHRVCWVLHDLPRHHEEMRVVDHKRLVEKREEANSGEK